MWDISKGNLIEAIEHSAELQGLIASDLMQDIHRRQGSQIIGSSRIMEHLRREIEIVVASDFTVMVLGETGVGKELVSQENWAVFVNTHGTAHYDKAGLSVQV
jgi:transcriptional regulator with GAF, ATPase, and Fis domain